MLYGIVGTSEQFVAGPGQEGILPEGAVPVAQQRPAPDAVLLADGTWQMPPERHEPEPLDLNAITYAQADALMRADTVEGLRLAVLDVLGL